MQWDDMLERALDRIYFQKTWAQCLDICPDLFDAPGAAPLIRREGDLIYVRSIFSAATYRITGEHEGFLGQPRLTATLEPGSV